MPRPPRQESWGRRHIYVNCITAAEIARRYDGRVLSAVCTRINGDVTWTVLLKPLCYCCRGEAWDWMMNTTLEERFR